MNWRIFFVLRCCVLIFLEMSVRPAQCCARSRWIISLPSAVCLCWYFHSVFCHEAPPLCSPPELCLRCDTICHFTLAKPHQQIVQRVALMQAAPQKKKEEEKKREIKKNKKTNPSSRV